MLETRKKFVYQSICILSAFFLFLLFRVPCRRVAQWESFTAMRYTLCFHLTETSSSSRAYRSRLLAHYQNGLHLDTIVPLYRPDVMHKQKPRTVQTDPCHYRQCFKPRIRILVPIERQIRLRLSYI